jgi:EAL domain-containing protein (putative c-di-GMP-specific phosphodiesterase class I)
MVSIAVVPPRIEASRLLVPVEASSRAPSEPGDGHAPEDTDQRTQQMATAAYVDVPIGLLDGMPQGSLDAYSDGASADDSDSAILRLVARSVTQHFSRRAQAEAAIRGRLADVLDNGLLSSAYQPIVDLATGKATAVEALARFDGRYDLRPDEWFADAARVGQAEALEMAALRCAVAGLDHLPPDVALSVNVSAPVMVAPVFAQWLEGAPVDRLILELTEHDAVSDYTELNAALAAGRARGLRLAVDDGGAGYASMRHALKLKPDLLKLDISLVRGVDADTDKRALVRAIVAFARSLGTRVVAEGVQTRAELGAVRRLDVDYVQGYVMARPSALADLRFDGYARNGPRARRWSPAVSAQTDLMIRELSDAGASPSTIAARLNRAGEAAPRGIRWHPRAIVQVLAEQPLAESRD